MSKTRCDTFTVRKKVTVQSGGKLNGYSHLLKHHTLTQAG